MAFMVAAAAPPLTLVEWIFALLCVLIGLSVAIAAKFSFKRPSFASPRLPENAQGANLWIAIFAGLFGQFVLPAMIAVPLLAPLAKPPTAHQTAILYLASSVGGMSLLLVAHRSQSPHWRMSRPMRHAFLPAIVGIGAVIPLVLAANFLVQQTWAMLHLPAPEGHALLTAFNDHTSSGADRCCVVISAVVAAPIFEEMLFRAHLQTAIRQLMGRPWVAIIIASALFGLAHLSAWMFAPLFLLAVGLGYIYERTANLYATILIHASFNALMIGLDLLSLSHR